MAMSLPLFEATENRAELKRLQERREVLLKRLQAIKPSSHRRWKVEAQLCDVTTELMKRELRSYPGWQR